ncbi:tyrosine-protein phosphatase [Conexibacter sp. SYSU D00693]|uniref:tyrosine-protein phosphatase n=1 Tax=Conexibacter sp. SYSU D00693 TaxID=2812560 RepID=UPI00196B9449|nr:CpsB/CapC family capsule biosynthesis tyrosine phosphatase [Conexibacter sp. SYSU D00693]
MIDLHCHVLPGIDDGPEDLEEALGLCRAQVAAGITTVVATPHVAWEFPDNDAARIAAGVASVRDALAREELDLQVLPGAEVALTQAAELDDEELRALTLGGGPWLLLEPPLSPAAPDFEFVLQGLAARGHRLLVAHPERIPAFLRDREVVERCVAEGMLMQVTAGSFVGRFGRDVQRFAMGMLQDGLVHNVASDAHGPSLRRPPGVREQLERVGYGDWVDHLCRAVPEALLAGTEPPEPPEQPTLRRRLFGGLRRAS